jgi:hypothetical protein
MDQCYSHNEHSQQDGAGLESAIFIARTGQLFVLPMGGEPSNLNIGWETAASALYKFQSDGLSGGECTVVGQTSASIFKDLRRGFEGATASRDDTWYLVGGVVSCHSDPSEHESSEFNILGPMIS